MAQFQAALANTLWVASCAPAWHRFDRSARQVQSVQEAILMRYLKCNSQTQYGQRYGFDDIHSVSEYQQRVPLTSYDDYVPLIEALANGHQHVLTSEPIRLFELSSGSSAASKLIPYTAGLQAEFQTALGAWIWDLYTHAPDLLSGSAYWSITPVLRDDQRTVTNIPIGFEDDSAYLGAWGKVLVNSILAAPNSLKQVQDLQTFRYLTLLCLLSHADLRLISIWNPTYLSLLLKPLVEWWPALLNDLACGSVKFPFDSQLSARRLAQMGFPLAPAPRRAQHLAALHPSDYESIWPMLGLIRCWNDGPSRVQAKQLANLFPKVEIQGKGLLATEAFVSFPLWDWLAPVLAVSAHFFEFIPEGAPGPALLAHQLDVGGRYEVVLTTAGGFYRYQLFDLVEVSGYYHQAPRLHFIGKAERVSDYFGEKLSERFVASVVERGFAQEPCRPVFVMLAPEEESGGLRYVLYFESAENGTGPGPGWEQTMTARLEQELCSNFHYDYCRRLGQLAPVRLQMTAPGAAARYLAACQARGQRLGNIKASVLQKTTGWGPWLTGPQPSQS